MTETAASEDLAIRHYPFKWRQAQRLAFNLRHHPDIPDYWKRVRLLYLELGGEYVLQLPALKRLQYWHLDTAMKG